MTDLYSGVDLLTDYLNEYANVSAIIQMTRRELGQKVYGEFTFEQLKAALAKSPIRTVGERLNEPCPTRDEMQKYPEVVARLDKLATLANKCPDLITWKQIRNEVGRLLYGKDMALNYPQPEFDPNLLKI